MAKRVLQFVVVHAIVYATILTAWSFTINFFKGQQFRYGWLGFAIIAIIYFYLKHVLEKLRVFESNRMILILSGTLIILMGCILSTTLLWFYNENLGLKNNIFNSIRASVANGLIGFFISLILMRNTRPPGESNLQLLR